MKLWISFLRKNLSTLLAFGIVTGVFAVMLYGNGLPLDSLLYSLLLCTAMCGGLGILGYLRYRRRVLLLKEAMAKLPVNLDDLPEASDALQELYQEMLSQLYDQCGRIRTQADQRRSDMTDYYTLWVHQIKTPIAAIRLLLQSGETDEKLLSGEVFKIQQYVEMVLQYLRLESDSTDYCIGHYDLDGIVRQAIRKYAPLFVRSKITLVYEPLNCTVLTDEKWLIFVVEQLLSNALKYTQKGSVRIYLRPEATLVIEDTGIGIAPEDMPRIFEKGFTGYNGRLDKKSSGIGLYLCKRILAKLGHGISATSQPGKGTAICVDLASVRTMIE